MNMIDWNQCSEAERAALLERPVQQVAESVRSGVAEIFGRVSAQGDCALYDYTRRFDGVVLPALEVLPDEFAQARSEVPEAVQAAILEAATRIDAFHRAGMTKPYALETASGMLCERITRPIERVGLYVPAGSAPLPSTALMLTIPARLAGCKDIIMCTPPRSDGRADPSVLIAAQQAPNVRVFKLGGAQAIAAMALGTASVPRCDKLFGPGNGWVDEAKRQVTQLPGAIAVDMPAGPSEVLVIADDAANPVFVAADLLSQAEHGPDSQVLLLTDSAALLEKVSTQIDMQLSQLPRAEIAQRALKRSRLILVQDILQAIEISNRYAPEHLILSVRQPRAWVERIQHAGSIFLGDYTPEALGDYCSGSNHVLPTSGAARAWSGLSVAGFQKVMTLQEATRNGIANVGACAATLAHAEGLQAHARAVELRLEALA